MGQRVGRNTRGRGSICELPWKPANRPCTYSAHRADGADFASRWVRVADRQDTAVFAVEKRMPVINGGVVTNVPIGSPHEYPSGEPGAIPRSMPNVTGDLTSLSQSGEVPQAQTSSPPRAASLPKETDAS